MSVDRPLKIAVIGPKGGGKTKLSNHFAKLTALEESPNYDPTAGVRILKFIVELKEAKRNEVEPVHIELWDCSGDQTYEPCWPAILKDLNGIVVVFDPSSATHTNDVTIWCDWFATKANLVTNQAIIIAFGGDASLNHQPFSAVGGKVMVPIVKVQKAVTVEGETSPAMQEFERYVQNLLPTVTRR